jgi:hypothetical protein
MGNSAPVNVTNEAAGVIDATGTVANTDGGGGGFTIEDAIYLVGDDGDMRNDGLMEATGVGGLVIANTTLSQSGGGTLLASGAGDTVFMQTVDLIGGDIEESDGGTIDFDLGTNTLANGPAPLVIGAGSVLEASNANAPGSPPGTLVLQAATIDNLGTLIDSSVLDLASPTITLVGGGLVQLSGQFNTTGATTLINTDNLVTNGVIRGSALDITNAAAGVFNGSVFNTGGTMTNAGLLENVSISNTTLDNTGTGNLLATAGASVVLNAADVIDGTLVATGGADYYISNGVTLDGRGAPVSIEAGTTLQDFFDQFSPPFTFETSGGLAMEGTIDFAGAILGTNQSAADDGPYTIPNAGLLVGTGEIAGFVANTGTLLAQGGTLDVTQNVDGSGSIAINSGAAFVLGVESGETVDFRNAQDGRLVLNTPTDFTGTLANMTYGDIFDVGTDDIQSAAVVGGNTLAVTLTDSSTIDYTLANLHAGTSIVPGSAPSELVVACFAEGTRIRTPDGEQRVEVLRAGDIVATAGGGSRKIIWVGHRAIACGDHPRPREVQPVCIRAHAFGPDAPCADLRLSPDHAVFVGGVLIPVRYLVNGATVVREDVAEITYWHLELDTHHALLAENLPCESYLDTGNRGAFVECDGAVMMHADFARAVWGTRSFAPLALAGPAVEAARRILLMRAEALGYRLTAEPALCLLVDGRKLWPQPGSYRFVLPAAARDIKIQTRAGVPAETSAASEDHRRLGVAVAALRGDGQAIALDDARLGSGWHAPERGDGEGAAPGWRWTDGAAALALSGVRELDVVVAITGRYWVQPLATPLTNPRAA